MIKSTNFRTKVLALAAMLTLSAGAVFGQPGPIANYFAGNDPLHGLKLLQWSNQTKLLAPITGSGTIAQGVKVTLSTAQDMGFFVNDTTAISQSSTIPTISPGTSKYWIDGSSLNAFAGENNRIAVSFDISTKYLTNVKDLQIQLGANTFGGAANMNVDYDVIVAVFDLAGNLVPGNQIYAGYDPAPFGPLFWREYWGEYNTSMGNKTIKLFQLADDLTEDHDFIEGSLNDKIIRVILRSKRPAAPTGVVVNNYPAALVVKGVTIKSSEPKLNLSRYADYNGSGIFNAGMKWVLDDPDNKLTISQDSLNLPTDATVKVTAPEGFLVEGNSLTAKIASVIFSSNPVTPEYQFAPQKINTFKGPFNAEGENFIYPIDPLSPIQALTAVSEDVLGNSVPELSLGDSKLIYTEGSNWTSKDVQIWGLNIPNEDLGDFRFVGGHADDQDDSALAYVGVDNSGFEIGDLGVIAPSVGNHISINFAQFLNNVDINVAKFVKMSRHYRVENAFSNGDDFTGRESRTFTNPDDELIPFPQILVVGNVGAVWFEYNGSIGTPTQIVGDISTAFYAPYNNEILPENQAVSRIKTFYLKGAKVKTNSDDNAVFTISLDKVAEHDNHGHMAFRYKLTNGSWYTADNENWKTPATTSTLTVKLLTAQQIKDFQEVGIPIQVQFKPDCDGFREAEEIGPREEMMYHNRYILYKWDPHFNCLMAEQTNTEGAAGASAIVFGDTRANLENTLHNWRFVDVMQNSIQVLWSKSLLTKSEFRKDYGNTFLGSCGEQNNPLKDGEFFITGYNLSAPVNVVANKDAYNPEAFKITVIPADGFGTADGLTITPNEYGEIAAKVTVEFAPTFKYDGRRNVNDFITVSYDKQTVENEGAHWWDPEFNYVDILKEYCTQHGPIHDLFLYPNYRYCDAILCGRVYDPTFYAVNVANMSAHVNANSTQTFSFMATDLDKTLKKVTIDLAKTSGTPFSITAPSAKTFYIDADGGVSGNVTLNFAPTPSTMCDNTNSLVYTYNTCINRPVEDSEVSGTTIVDQPTFGAFQPGDIQGDRVDLRITPAVGGPNYEVGIGVMKYAKKTQSIFMSEVLAANDSILIELFNGTGEELNGDILPDHSPNYYLEIYKSGSTTPTQIILNSSDVALWTPYGIEVKTLHYDMDADHDYKIVLKQGQITLDVYEFTGESSHMARLDNLSEDAYKTTTFNQPDWATVAWHTSLNLTSSTAVYPSLFCDNHLTEMSPAPVAKFYEYFDDEAATKTIYGFGKGASVSNLKKGVTYTAYAKTLPDCDAVVVDGHPAKKLVPCSDSNRITGDPMDGVTFGFFTGIDQVEVAKNIYASNGKIYVAGASEGVTIFNALGMQVKAATIEEAAAGIAVPNGIYMVKSGDKTAKVLVNK